MTARTAGGLVLAALLFATAVAGAQATDAADGLLRDGVEQRRQGHDEEALALFRRAYEHSHSPIALAQMGLAEQALGHWLEAEAHVRGALRAIDNPWIAHNRSDIDRAYELIREHVGTIEVRGGQPGAMVSINGESAGTLPLREPIRAPAGTVTLEVRAPGYYPVSRSVAVTGGEVSRESVELRRMPGGADHGDSPGAQRTVGVVLAGSAVLALAAGFISLGVRETAVSAYNADATCPGIDVANQPDACAQRISTGNAAGIVEVGGIALGAALAVTSIAILLTAPSSHAHGDHARAHFACGAGPGEVGVACAIGY